jgi:predicted dehydrogenase
MAEKLKAALVGCGLISRAWLRAAQTLPDLEMVALVDLDEGAANDKAEEFDLAKAVVDTDLPRVLDQTRPDLVFDCTAPEAHLSVTLEALRHGCHVLGEKPMADSLESAQRMAAAAQKAGRLYAVMQNRRFDPNIRRLKRFLASGAIGRVTTVHSDFFLGAHIGGFRDHMRHVLLLDMAIHTFDAARFMTGVDASTVFCQEWNPPGSWFDHDASAVAIFEMGDGIVYTYRGSWCAEGLRTPWESEWRVIGDKGSVVWDGAEGFRAEVVAKAGGFLSDMRELEVPPHRDAATTGGHAGLIRDFVRCVQTGRMPGTICTDNIKSLAMVFGAIESAELGARVAIVPQLCWS